MSNNAHRQHHPEHDSSVQLDANHFLRHDPDAQADSLRYPQPEPPGPYFYATTRMPKPIGFALLHGTRQGIVCDDDLPAIPRDDADYQALVAWWREVHAVLDQRGVLASYRQHLVMDARAASCPAWCFGEHEMVYQHRDTCLHHAPLAEVRIDGQEPVTLSLTADEEGDELFVPTIVASEDLGDGLASPAAAAAWGDGLLRAAKRAAMLLGQELDRPASGDLR